MPPSWAIAIARRDSVTVSIAAETSGMFSGISRVRRVRVVDLARQHLAVRRDQQHVVEGQGLGDAGLAHRLGSPQPARAQHPSSRRQRRPRRGTSCTSCPSRRGTGRCGPTLRDLARRPSRRRPCAVTPAAEREAAAKICACSRAAALFFLPALLVGHRIEQEQEAHRVVLDALLHLREHLERLALVLDERVALAVGAQADAVLQVVHRQQVVLPRRVDDLQQDVPLVAGASAPAPTFASFAS